MKHYAAALVVFSLCAFGAHCALAAAGQPMPSGGTDVPRQRLIAAVLVAGGGASDFKTTLVLGRLAGASANAEVVTLVQRYGAARVKQFIAIDDFAVADMLRLAKRKRIMLQATPAPDPNDGKALFAALYAAGRDQSTGTFGVQAMLDRLVTHALHIAVMKDIDVRYGIAADAAYHVALLQVMNDLKTAQTP